MTSSRNSVVLSRVHRGTFARRLLEALHTSSEPTLTMHSTTYDELSRFSWLWPLRPVRLQDDGMFYKPFAELVFLVRSHRDIRGHIALHLKLKPSCIKPMTRTLDSDQCSHIRPSRSRNRDSAPRRPRPPGDHERRTHCETTRKSPAEPRRPHRDREEVSRNASLLLLAHERRAQYCRDSEVGEVLSSECWRFRVFKANALELTMSLAFQRTRLHGTFANTRMRAQAMHHATAGAAAFSAARPCPTEPILFVLSLFVP